VPWKAESTGLLGSGRNCQSRNYCNETFDQCHFYYSFYNPGVYYGYQAIRGEKQKVTPVQEDTARVVAATAAPHTFSEKKAAVVSRKARKYILLNPKVNGNIQDILVDFGGRVSREDIVVRLEKANYDLAVQQAKAVLSSAVVRDIKADLASLELPQGVEIKWGGDVEEQRKAFRDLLLLLILGIILVYMIMASQFENFIDPFVIMFSVPFAFVGVIWAFVLTATPLNLMSFIGVIMLMGILVNNAIVLVDYVRQLRERGVHCWKQSSPEAEPGCGRYS